MQVLRGDEGEEGKEGRVEKEVEDVGHLLKSFTVLLDRFTVELAGSSELRYFTGGTGSTVKVLCGYKHDT